MNSQILILFIYLLIDIISFAAVLPVFPELINSFANSSNDFILKKGFGYLSLFNLNNNGEWNNVLIGGILGFSFCSCQFIFSPILGALSDSYGRKKLLILTTLGMILSYMIWSFSYPNLIFTWYLLSRIIGGSCRANVAISIAVVGDLYEKNSHSSGMALIGVAFSLGFIIGPCLGVFSGSYGLNSVAMLCCGLSIIDLVVLIVGFKESLPEIAQCNDKKKSKSICKEAWLLINPYYLFRYQSMSLLKFRDLTKARTLGLIYFYYLFIYSGLEFTLTFLTQQRFNYTSKDQGRMFCFIGVIMILVQGGLVRRVKQRSSPQLEKKFVMIGLVSLMPSFLLIALSTTSATQFYLGLTLFSLASGCVVPCMTSLVSRCDNPSMPQQGRLMGILRSQGSLARALGPLFTSMIFWLWGPTITYCLGTIMLIVPFVMLYRFQTE